MNLLNRNVDKDGPVPIYSQIEGLILDMIGNGVISPDQRAPSEREIAKSLGISRMTARAAMSNLIADGYLYSVPGKGTFVSNPKMRKDLLELTSFTEDMRRQGLTASARLLGIGTVTGAPPKIYRALDLPEGEELIRIHRLRTADGVPMVLENSYLPKSPLRWLLEEELEDQSLYRLLEDRGIEIVKAEEHLEATLIREAESELLAVPVGSPALLIERVAYTSQGEPIEYVKSVCRGDRYRFSTMMTKRRSRKGINSL